jgi:hypothetical protein
MLRYSIEVSFFVGLEGPTNTRNWRPNSQQYSSFYRVYQTQPAPKVTAAVRHSTVIANGYCAT